MPLKVGITGAIGSGKTTVCKIFESLRIPVFYADIETKRLYLNSEIKTEIKKLFGENVFTNQEVDTKKLGTLVFKNKELIAILNNLLHPIAIQKAIDWHNAQTTTYTLKEAALLVESGSYKNLDILIGVKCNEETRINRTIIRENLQRDEVLNRMKNQLSEEEKLKHCHYIIENNDDSFLIPQVIKIHNSILKHVNEKQTH